MPWQRMLFRGDPVWVRVDANSRMVLDSAGRAEMKYREGDPKSYRPASSNLAPPPPGAVLQDDPPARSRTPAGTKVRAPALATAAAETWHVWTDGACSGNPGPMGIGMVLIGTGVRQERGEYLGIGTNNIAELTAIERGLAMVAELKADANRPIRIYSDSAYSIGLLSQGWKAKANQELVARLRVRLADFPDVAFVKVAGHAGIPENERCDELAREAIVKRAIV